MYERIISEYCEILHFTFEGERVEACEGDSVSAALLLAGKTVNRRTTVSGRPRSAYCMMGVCFECLLEIDGKQNQQGCMVGVKEGMDVRIQAGKREVLR